MATEATFTVSGDAFPLGSLFEAVPDVTVELERVVPTEPRAVPYFWVYGHPIDDVVSAFGEHPGVDGIELIDEVDGQYLLRCVWSTDHEGVLTGILDTGVTLLEATGTAGEWTFVVRGDTHEDAARFQRYCQDREIPITLRSLHSLEPIHATPYELTETQLEALLLAYDRGYYDTPRTITLEELGSELGISHQALASRLRRGIRRLVAELRTEVT